MRVGTDRMTVELYGGRGLTRETAGGRSAPRPCSRKAR
jgi:hypothetical protein